MVEVFPAHKKGVQDVIRSHIPTSLPGGDTHFPVPAGETCSCSTDLFLQETLSRGTIS